MTPLTVVRIAHIPKAPTGSRGLIEGLWGAQACGFIGGVPKTGKTWLGLDLAVASGVPALGRFPVHQPRPVLPSTTEDPCTLRQRVAGIAPSAVLENLAVAPTTAQEIRA